MNKTDDNATNITIDQITVQLPSTLIAQIDAQINSSFIDRQDFIRTAIRHYLRALRAKRGLGYTQADDGA